MSKSWCTICLKYVEPDGIGTCPVCGEPISDWCWEDA